MTRWWTIAACTVALLFALPLTPAHAEGPLFVHVVRPGETLASIAQRYYGEPRRERVLVAENGLTGQGGASIVVGLRLTVPTVQYHRVQSGESWAQLAARFYGDARRAAVIIEANGGSSSSQPDVGAEILIPYPVRHIAGQSETLTKISQHFYDSADQVKNLQRFNRFKTTRVPRGQLVLIPMADLKLSPEGRHLVEERVGESVAGGQVRGLQVRVESQLPQLREHVRRGHFIEAVALGNRLLGTSDLTGNQIVTIQRELGTAYVALERDDLSVAAFKTALEHQPDMELDTTRTSPTVLRAFRRAAAGVAKTRQGDAHGPAATRDGAAAKAVP